MAAFSYVLVTLLFASNLMADAKCVAPATGCPMALNTGSVGGCKWANCAASRGPTHCRFGSCFCNTGYCRYPTSTLHIQSRYCVARVPSSSCHLTRVCYKAGLTTSFCDKGECMCKYGYKIGCDGSCVSDVGVTDEILLAGNMTQIEKDEVLAVLQMEANAVAFNVFMFTAWMTGAVTLAVGGSVFMYRKLRVKEEESDYDKLADGPALYE